MLDLLLTSKYLRWCAAGTQLEEGSLNGTILLQKWLPQAGQRGTWCRVHPMTPRP